MSKVVFVCTGNTCRSPMAEALLRCMLEERGLEDRIIVTSAGIYAFEGDEASPLAIDVMEKEYGIDLTRHRARVLYDQEIGEASLILVMTRHHKEMIADIYPEALNKVHLLKEYAGLTEGTDVIDPYGHDYYTYKRCANELEDLLLGVLDKICELQD